MVNICEPRHPICGRFTRRHKTQGEQIAELEAYLRGLKLEMQAVEENLAELRK